MPLTKANLQLHATTRCPKLSISGQRQFSHLHSEPGYLFCHCPVSEVSLYTPKLPNYYLLGSILLLRVFCLFLRANCYLLQNYKDPCKHPVIAHKLHTVFKFWDMHFYLSNSCATLGLYWHLDEKKIQRTKTIIIFIKHREFSFEFNDEVF